MFITFIWLKLRVRDDMIRLFLLTHVQPNIYFGLRIASLIISIIGNPVRTDLQYTHVLVCHKRQLNWSGPSNETTKTEAPCDNRCSAITIPLCSNVPGAEHRTKFFRLYASMGTFLYERNILELDLKHQTFKQSMTFFIKIK